jgi:hypothetical protein
MRRLSIVTIVLCTALIAGPATAQTAPMSHSSPLVGIAKGQRAHLTLVHPGTEGRCSATLAFVDDRGSVLKSERVELGPGQGTFLALEFADAATSRRGRLHYRAVFTPAEGSCVGAIAGHEMIDDNSDKTTVFIGVYQE